MLHWLKKQYRSFLWVVQSDHAKINFFYGGLLLIVILGFIKEHQTDAVYSPLNGTVRRPQLPPLIRIKSKETPQKGVIGSGTAFLDHESQLWLTSRHVTVGCKSVYVPVRWPEERKTYFEFGNDSSRLSKITQSNIRIDKSNDIAAFWRAQSIQEGIERAEQPDLSPGDFGMAIGFPGGKKGEVELQYIGNTYSRTSDSIGEYDSYVQIWSVAKWKIQSNGLGGLSGGPVLNHQGKLVGMMQASSKDIAIRRGRVITISGQMINRFMNNNSDIYRHSESELTAAPVYKADEKLPDALRDNFQVIRIICER